MFRVRVGDRPLPLIWSLEAGTANLGFEAQRALLQTDLPAINVAKILKQFEKHLISVGIVGM